MTGEDEQQPHGELEIDPVEGDYSTVLDGSMVILCDCILFLASSILHLSRARACSDETKSVEGPKLSPISHVQRVEIYVSIIGKR